MRFHRTPWAVPFLVLGVSLGFVSSARAQDKLITEGDSLKYFKGTEQPPANWADVGFDDSAWLDGSTPIGYGPDLTFKTTLDDMINTYFTFYTRFKFNVGDPAAIKALRTLDRHDDGIVVYLNGVEVLRKNMPVGAVTKDTPGQDHEILATFETSVLACAAIEALKGGENVLGVELHNATINSSDAVLTIELEPVESVCPTALTCTVRATATGDQVLVRWTKPTGVVYEALALYRNEVAITPPPVKTATTYTDKTPIAGVNTYRIVATACGVECSSADQPTCSATVGSTEPKFKRGDVDDNGAVNITDSVKLLAHLFQGQPAPACLDAADADDNSAVNITDAVYILSALFKGGPQPPAPGADCGVDPTVDTLAACTYANCQ